MFSSNRTVLGDIFECPIRVLKKKSTRSEERNTITTISKKNSPSKWSWLGSVNACLFCFHITELSDLGCRRIFCQNQLYKRVMKFLEISLHCLLLTQLENRATNKGYFYDLSAVWSLLCPLLLRQKRGRGSPVWPGQMGSLGLYLFILGRGLYCFNPQAHIAAEAGHHSYH